jgi:PAS domain S-box-containing protein
MAYALMMTASAKKAAATPRVRFSTLLLTTMVLLVAGTVAVNLIALHQYFIKSVQTEFYDKLRAQKGQVNILLESRIAGVQRSMQDLVENNAVRVTLMLKDDKQLQEKVLAAFPPSNGVYCFIESRANRSVILPNYPDLPGALIKAVLNQRPLGELVRFHDTSKLVWLFSTPILHQNRSMGTAFVLYDFLQDNPLQQTISLTVDGDIGFLDSGRLVLPFSGRDIAPAAEKLTDMLSSPLEFVALDDDLTLSALTPYKNLYILYPLADLNAEIQKVALYMGLAAVLALTVSIFISAYLGKRLMKPLKAISDKAARISKGEREVRFEASGGFREFAQLSEAFDFMMTHLREAEEKSRYRELLEKVDDAVYLLDGSGSFLEANTAVYHRLGYHSDDFFHLKLKDILPVEDARTITGLLGDGPSADRPRHLVFETRHIRRDGEKIPVEIRSQCIEYMGTAAVLNVARDISLRVEMESALRESEERYRSVVENSSDGIMIIDRDGRIIYANELLAAIFGHPLRVMEGSRLEQYLDLNSAAGFMGDPSTAACAPGNQRMEGVFQIIRRDGEKRQVKVRTNHFIDSSGSRKTVAQVFDITDQLRMEEEKRQLEEQFLHAQKLEAVGTLAGGIAHDFNNLLMGIQGRLSVMRLQMDATDPNMKNIEAIDQTVSSAANLTRQLLGFARKGRCEITPASVNDLIEKSTRMFIRTRKEIQLQTFLQPDIHKVEIDPGQIEQVLINMYVNAWQAMPDGGKLIIETSEVNLDQEFCTPHNVEPGPYVKIVLTDTGIGMSPKIIQRIFEPFFTTKDVGKGTGLGLASAYGIIRNHKGMIQVESEPGQGTSFMIYLPACQSASLAHPVAMEEMIEGRGTILIVDDEIESLQAEESMLQRLGYDVLKAGSGPEAIRIFKNHRERIDLVTLDMIMPGMGGKETFEKLRRIDPAVKILFISGYGINHDIEEIAQDELSGFLEKPFGIVKLSQKVIDFMQPSEKARDDASGRGNLIKLERFGKG